MDDSTAAPWLLLIHQMPPKPAYFRVKVWRRLQALGAVTIKNSVYVLPRGEQTLEDLQWVRREIEAGGGEATVCEARFIDGLSDDQVRHLFNTARDADYGELADEARLLLESLPDGVDLPDDRRAEAETLLRRLRRRFAQIAALDFFRAAGQEMAEGLLAGIEARLRPSTGGDGGRAVGDGPTYRGRTWVTRQGVHVDRIACAWLIRRFIDPDARFKFVPAKDYRPEQGELRFDMFEAEFTHQGDRCTFEVLLDHFTLDDPALAAIAEVVHDIDLKDGKFRREEAAGVGRLIAGIAMTASSDDERLVRGATIFDGLLGSFASERQSGTEQAE